MPNRQSSVIQCFVLSILMSPACWVTGCSFGNPNEAEYKAHTPPGKPPANPNESFADRRQRTLRVPQKIADAQAKTKAEAEKREAAKNAKVAVPK